MPNSHGEDCGTHTHSDGAAHCMMCNMELYMTDVFTAKKLYAVCQMCGYGIDQLILFLSNSKCGCVSISEKI